MPGSNFTHSQDDALGAALGQTLGRALFGDPEMRRQLAEHQAKLEQMGAQTEQARAHAGLYTKQGEGVGIQNDASRSLPALIERLAQPPAPAAPADPLAPLAEAPTRAGGYYPSPTEAMRVGLPAVIAAMAQMNGDKVDPRQIVGSLGAYMGDDEMARRALVAQGHTPGERFAITPERADDIRGQEFGADYRKAVDVENIESGDRRYGVNVRSSDTRRGQDIASSDRRRGQDIGSDDKRYGVDNKRHDRAQGSRVGKRLTAAAYQMLFGVADDPDQPGELHSQLEERNWPRRPDGGTMARIRAAVVQRYQQTGNPAQAVSEVLDDVWKRWQEKQATAAQLRDGAMRAIARGADRAAVAARYKRMTGQDL